MEKKLTIHKTFFIFSYIFSIMSNSKPIPYLKIKTGTNDFVILNPTHFTSSIFFGRITKKASISKQLFIYLFPYHRVHHKFSETDADPHNAKRGFFFSHIGWLMMRKHNDVFIKGASVDMSDLEKDPIVMFQKK